MNPIAVAALAVFAIGLAYLARAVFHRRRSALDVRTASEDIFDTIEEGLLLLDRGHRVAAANRAARAMLSASDQRLEGALLDTLLPTHKLSGGWAAQLERSSVHDLEIELSCAGGEARLANVSARGIVAGGDRVGTVLAVRDVTEARRAAGRLAHAATHDALTGLPNRALLSDRLSVAIARAQRNQTTFAVVVLDLDGFKDVNDVFGHEAGDALLREASALLQQSVRNCDTVARLGADEFAVLLEEVAGKDGAEVVARRIVRRLHEGLTLASRGLSLTTSLGISMFPSDALDVQTLLRNADMAMYVQKNGGGNGYAFFASDMRAALEQRSAIKAELQHAIERDELFLHYQPLVDTRTGTISGMEALLRWRHPELGMVSPAVFVPIAEASGLILPIGDWVLREACRQARDFERNGLGRLPIAVNLSAKQLNAPQLVATVLEALAACDLGPERLVLEVTESALMEDEQRAASMLAELHRHGLEISLDDFGTGYSSLARLRALPISTLKIDRTFVRHVAENAADAAIVSAVVAMARSLHMTVVAEGVETQEQLDALRLLREQPHGALSVDEVQGYLFSRPVDAQAMAALLRARAALPSADPPRLTAACAQGAG